MPRPLPRGDDKPATGRHAQPRSDRGEATARRCLTLAAEPQSAPAQTASIPGRIVPVGNAPEGVVVDATTRMVAVAKRDPNEFVLLNADTGDIAKRVPLPGFVRHLQLAVPAGSVVVPVESATHWSASSCPAGGR